MATKTISLRVEAYERLRSAKRRPGESFSDVVMRAEWPKQTVTGSDLLAHLRARGPLLDEADLEALERNKSLDLAPADKWQTT
jgi:predicted CopG family antitoxin